MSTYGATVSEVSDRIIFNVGTAIISGMANKGNRHDIDTVFAVASGGTDLDPVGHLEDKVMALRRPIAKRPHLRNHYADIIRQHRIHYNDGVTINEDSMCQSNGELQFLRPAPHPTRGNRSDWKGNVVPLGPIGHLTRAILFSGASLNTKFDIMTYNDAPVNILEIPYHHLHSII